MGYVDQQYMIRYDLGLSENGDILLYKWPFQREKMVIHATRYGGTRNMELPRSPNELTLKLPTLQVGNDDQT